MAKCDCMACRWVEAARAHQAARHGHEMNPREVVDGLAAAVGYFATFIKRHEPHTDPISEIATLAQADMDRRLRKAAQPGASAEMAVH